MRLKMLAALMTASLTLWGVDLRLQRQQVLREQASLEGRTRRLEEELRRIRIDVQQEMADPRLLLALEGLGYHRQYRDTRALARRLIEGEDGSRLAREGEDDRPLW